MEFTLFLKGKVKSNGTPKVKHEIRIKFHEQLNELLNLFTKNNKNSWKEKRMITNKLYKSRHGKHFICLITENLNTYAELNVNFYVPKQTSFKDIDNKLKTICDALSLPGKDNGNAKIIKAWSQENKKNPLICLLENDSLIYKIHADTDFIFEMHDKNDKFFNDHHDMLCVINIKIKGNRQLESKYSDLIV